MQTTMLSKHWVATLEQSEFKAALDTCGKAIIPSSKIPVLTNYLIEVGDNGGVSVVACDGSFTIQKTIREIVNNRIAVLVPGRVIRELVAKLPKGKPVELQIAHTPSLNNTNGSAGKTSQDTGIELIIRAGKGEYTFAGQSPDIFPMLHKMRNEMKLLCTLNTNSFMPALERALSVAIKADGEDHYTTTVLFDFTEQNTFNIVSTDGMRLGVEEIQNDAYDQHPGKMQLLVPQNVAAELAKVRASEIAIYYKENPKQVCFKCGDTEYTSTLVDRMYPTYQKVFPSDSDITAKSYLEVDDLNDSLPRMILLGRSKDKNPVLFTRAEDQVMNFTVDTGKICREVLPSENIGEQTMEIAISPIYLLDVCKLTPKGTQVCFNFKSYKDPLIITFPRLPHYKHALMPVRLD